MILDVPPHTLSCPTIAQSNHRARGVLVIVTRCQEYKGLPNTKCFNVFGALDRSAGML